MATGTSTLTDQDVAALRGIIDSHVKAVLDHDPDAYLATCTDEVTLLPPEQPALVGRAACRAFLEAFPRSTSFVPTIEDLEGEGSLAYMRGTVVASIEDSETTFTFLTINRKQSDGTWKLVRDIWNTNAPAPQ